MYTDDKMATIGLSNIDSIHKLFVDKAPLLDLPTPPRIADHLDHLPCNTCKTILSGARKKAVRATCDSTNLFIMLASMHKTAVNNNICSIFDLVYSNIVTEEIEQYCTDT